MTKRAAKHDTRVCREASVHGYSRGCRCDGCREAWNAYHRDYKAKRRADRDGFYRDRDEQVRVRLTGLGLQIAAQAAARTGRSVDEIIEASLRCCGSDVSFGQSAA